MPDALARMRSLLPALPQSAALKAFLPPLGGPKAPIQLQRRAALASTLVAGLELSRDGAAVLSQEVAFGGIIVRPGDAKGVPAAQSDAA